MPILSFRGRLLWKVSEMKILIRIYVLENVKCALHNKRKNCRGLLLLRIRSSKTRLWMIEPSSTAAALAAALRTADISQQETTRLPRRCIRDMKERSREALRASPPKVGRSEIKIDVYFSIEGRQKGKGVRDSSLDEWEDQSYGG